MDGDGHPHRDRESIDRWVGTMRWDERRTYDGGKHGMQGDVGHMAGGRYSGKDGLHLLQIEIGGRSDCACIIVDVRVSVTLTGGRPEGLV